MNILVTGAAGFIGSQLSEQLALNGHDVIGIDSFSNYYARKIKTNNVKQMLSKGVKFFPLDLSLDNFTPIIRNIEFVFHLAAQPGLLIESNSELYFKNNIVATFRLLETLKNSHSLHGFINISSSSVYGLYATGCEETECKPNSLYGVTKLTAEQLVLSYYRKNGMPNCSLRLFSVYGPRERPDKLFPQVIRSLLLNNSYIQFEGSINHSRSFTYVNDIIIGMISLLNRFDSCIGEIFNFGSDISYSVEDALKIIEKYFEIPLTSEMKPKRDGDQIETCANIKKAKSILGFNPQTKLEDGLIKEIEWFKTISLP